MRIPHPLGPAFSKCLLQVILPWCWYCEREFEDEKGTTLQRSDDAAVLTVLCSPYAAPEGQAL